MEITRNFFPLSVTYTCIIIHLYTRHADACPADACLADAYLVDDGVVFHRCKLPSVASAELTIFFFSRVHATLELAVSGGRSVPSHFDASGFGSICPCPTVRDWGAVYPALLKTRLT